MDSYTKKTKLWLNKRFSEHDEHGIYFAHQPIYGFLKGHSEPNILERYLVTFQIMTALSHLKFTCALDVGGAEGYKTYIVKNLFNAKVKNSDLSEEACKRAEEIFDIKSIAADIHSLPFKDEEFDVVLCSETLEHVTNTQKAIDELLRVAKKAVIITVPHEPVEIIEKNIDMKNKIDHAHIHSFTPESLNFLNSKGYSIINKKMISSFVVNIAKQIENIPNRYYENNDDLVNLVEKMVGLLIRFDDSICKVSLSAYHGILFIVLKDVRYYTEEAISDITPDAIMNLSVPYYRLEPVLQTFQLPEENKKISFHIDRVDQDEKVIEISGWGFIKGEDSKNTKIYITLHSDKNNYSFDTIIQNRPDVTSYFKTFDLDGSGFLAVVPQNNLEKGTYKVGIHIKKDDFEGFCLTNNIVEI